MWHHFIGKTKYEWHFMWHLTENMDEEATNANEIEFQDIKSKQFQFSRYKIQTFLIFKR